VIKVEIGKFLAISPIVRFTAYQRGPALLARIDEANVPRALHLLGYRVLPLSPLSPPPRFLI
jgi:hypothetical protein